jgi:peptidoglycan/LPS O-acetylase OafA/YrhL
MDAPIKPRPDMTAQRAAYRPDIDGLRAVAVAAVIVNHFQHRFLAGGYLGVDIFFVISGFVITTSLLHRPATSLPRLMGDFFARRFRQLVPALALCVAGSGLTAWAIDPHPAASLNTGLAALAGVSNFQLLHTAQDYFAPATALNLFTQTWSLGVEEQFYLLFPALVWVCGLARTEGGARRLFRACLVISVLSVGALLLLPGKEGGAAYFLVLGRLWELGCGCMAAVMRPLERPGWAWLGLGGVIASVALPLPASVLTGLCVVPPTMLLILAGGAPRLLAWRPLVAVGRMSYSLYLWHWPVISAGLLMFGRFDGYVPVELALMLALAAASYRLIERPARTRLATLPRRWSALTALGCVTVVGAVLLALLQWPNPHPLVERRFLSIPPEFEPFPETGVDHMSECVIDGRFRLRRPTTFAHCTLAPSGGVANTVWAMGDSHAGQLQGLLVALHEQTGLGIHLIETPGVPFPEPPQAPQTDGDAFFAMTLPLLKPGDTILLGRLFLSRTGGLKPLPDVTAWIAAAEALAEQVRPLGVRVVIAGPPPMFRFDSIYGCASARDGSGPCDMPRATLAAAIEPVEAAIDAAARRQPNLRLFSAFAVLCPPSDAVCSPVRAWVPQYRDEDHLNSAGSRLLEPAFARLLAATGGP